MSLCVCLSKHSIRQSDQVNQHLLPLNLFQVQSCVSADVEPLRTCHNTCLCVFVCQFVCSSTDTLPVPDFLSIFAETQTSASCQSQFISALTTKKPK